MSSAFDVHFQIRTAADSNGEKLFTFAYASAKGVRGFQKTINQWLKCLLTPKGSDITAKTYGTAFADLLGTNTFSTSDVSERVVLAVEDATAQILAYQRAQSAASLPNEERLASASVALIEQTSTTGYTVYVVLKNVLNQGVKYALPTF